MIDIFNKAKEFIGLGPDEEMFNTPSIKTETLNVENPPVRSRSSRRSSNTDSEISIYEPKAYENSIEISAKLRQGSPVIVNLKYLDSGEGTRLIDFVCGTAFAIDGHMIKIADTIFLLTPSNIAISEILDNPSSEGPITREGLLHNR
ncbi:MAG: cell division protein SepF [Candidatus Saganbacteria bacterium]|nr:cell division protein SepF [Candidatus Saganbacteria bacterium]